MPASRTARQQRAPLLRGQRWRAAFRSKNTLYNRYKIIPPTPQSLRVAFAETGKRLDRAVDIRPPFKRPPVACQQRHIKFGLDVFDAVTFQFEIGEPRHSRDRPLKERMRIVE